MKVGFNAFGSIDPKHLEGPAKLEWYIPKDLVVKDDYGETNVYDLIKSEKRSVENLLDFTEEGRYSDRAIPGNTVKRFLDIVTCYDGFSEIVERGPFGKVERKIDTTKHYGKFAKTFIREYMSTYGDDESGRYEDMFITRERKEGETLYETLGALIGWDDEQSSYLDPNHKDCFNLDLYGRDICCKVCWGYSDKIVAAERDADEVMFWDESELKRYVPEDKGRDAIPSRFW